MDNLLKDLADSYYNEALNLVKNRELTKAIIPLKKALEIVNDDVDILSLFGLVLFKLNYISDGTLMFEKAVELSKENEVSNKYLEILNSENFAKYKENYNNALECINKRKFRSALKFIYECEKVDFEIVDLHIIKGLCLCEVKQFNKGLASVKKALDIDKSNEMALKYLGKIKRRRPKALFYVIILLIVAIIITLGIVFNLISDNKNLKVENEKYLSMVNEIEDVSVNTHISSHEEIRENSFESLENNEFKDSIKGFNELFNNSPDVRYVEEACYFLALSYEKDGSYIEALEYYEVYTSKFKGKGYYGESLYNAALLSYKNGDKEKARKYANVIKKELPNSIYYNSKIKYILE